MSDFVCRVCKGRRLIDGPSGHPEDATGCPACEDDEAHQRAEARTGYECHDGSKCSAEDKTECDSKCRRLSVLPPIPINTETIYAALVGVFGSPIARDEVLMLRMAEAINRAHRLTDKSAS